MCRHGAFRIASSFLLTSLAGFLSIKVKPWSPERDGAVPLEEAVVIFQIALFLEL